MKHPLRVAIVHNAVDERSAPDEIDVLDQAEAITAALEELSYIVTQHSCDLDLGISQLELVSDSPDVIFNLVESLEGHGRLIHLPPAMFETIGIPYTGSPSEALLITSHKTLAKQMMAAAGLPTPLWYMPDYFYHPGLAECGALDGKIILKSIWEHASLGMSDAAVREISGAGLDETLRDWSAKTGGACFAERYIDGREFNISLLDARDGPQVLPPAEIRFVDYPPDKPKIVGYAAKWAEEAFEFGGTPRCFDFEPDDQPLLEKLSELSIECWRLFGLRGYVRVDFRVDSDGNPWILEVNANPCLARDAGFAAACARADISYADLIDRIVGLALGKI